MLHHFIDRKQIPIFNQMKITNNSNFYSAFPVGWATISLYIFCCVTQGPFTFF